MDKQEYYLEREKSQESEERLIEFKQKIISAIEELDREIKELQDKMLRQIGG